MLIVRIRSVKISAKYVQQAMGRRQNAEDEAEKKSVLRSENAVEIEFSWFRVGEKRRNCFQSNSFRLSTRRREKEMWIWNFYAMHFDLLYDASPTRKKVRTRGDEFVQFSSRCCRSCRPLESVFFAQDRWDFLRLRSASFSLFKNFHTTLNRPARLRRC